MSFTPAHIKEFMRTHYRHFNSAVCVDAAEGWCDLLKGGGRMFMTMAGAMSTAELGRSLAEMIRQDKISAITCTGANLEEDLYNLVAHTHYERLPNYRHLTVDEEQKLYDRGLNRVTDTAIPEEEALRKIEGVMGALWQKAEKEGKRFFPHEFFYQAILSDEIQKQAEIPLENSWLLAAAQKNLPMFVPGWEDSTNGNMIVAAKIEGRLKSTTMVKTGLEYMERLAEWYTEESARSPIGFFQIGGGIAGDFPICVVPMLVQDLERKVPKWAYFAQISDSTTSYGSYSGAVPNEKITWGKLETKGPKYIIESDATIVAPLIFMYVLAG